MNWRRSVRDVAPIREEVAYPLRCPMPTTAPVIVTSNITDFPESVLTGYGIRAVRPDAFAIELLSVERRRFLRAVREHRASLKNPPKSVEEYLSSLAVSGLLQTAQRLKESNDEI